MSEGTFPEAVAQINYMYVPLFRMKSVILVDYPWVHVLHIATLIYSILGETSLHDIVFIAVQNITII